jgi:putative acetyltransferase
LLLSDQATINRITHKEYTINYVFYKPIVVAIIKLGCMSPHSFLIRPELPEDITAITSIVDEAFLGMPYAEGDEAALIVELRRLGELSISLVAEENGFVVGQVAFSQARSSDGAFGWYGLGPIAVLPKYQHRGIGSALMRAGLESIDKLGANGCILVGHPQFYVRFGFINAPGTAPANEPSEHFMVKLFRGQMPSGPIYFHPAFKNELDTPLKRKST